MSRDGSMKKLLISASLLIASGCTTTGALNIAPDTYRVSVRVAWSGDIGAQDESLKQANAYCQTKGKAVAVVAQRSNGCAFHGGCGQAQTDFKCE
jgi:hypothetical protein